MAINSLTIKQNSMAKKNNQFPLIFKNDIIFKNHETIVNYLNENEEIFGALSESNYWSGRVFFFESNHDPKIVQILQDHKDFLLKKFYALSGVKESIYLDTLSFTRWPKGYELLPHADAENPNGEPHDYPWRDFGTVTFLNSNFSGGELYLPDLDLVIEPTPGYTVIFPGTMDFLHGVKKITKGTRYTIASFLTFDKSKSMF